MWLSQIASPDVEHAMGSCFMYSVNSDKHTCIVAMATILQRNYIYKLMLDVTSFSRPHQSYNAHQGVHSFLEHTPISFTDFYDNIVL